MAKTNLLAVILCVTALLTLLSCAGAKRRKAPHLSGAGKEDRESSRDQTEVKGRRGNGNRGRDVTADVSRAQDSNSDEQTLTQDVFKRRMRAKHIRLFDIQQKILHGLGMEEQPNFTVPLPHRNMGIPDLSAIHWAEEPDEEKVIHRASDDYLAKSVQALSPSCQVPHKSDDKWSDDAYFRLYFDIDKDVEKSERVQFSTSTLWLYKKPIEDNEGGGVSRDKRSQKQNRKRKNRHITNEEDHNLKITVYRYLRPVRKDRKGKKELVSSQVVAKDFYGWVKLDMKAAVQSWLNKPRKNFGLLVVAENSDRVLLKPDDVFVTPNCSIEGGIGPQLPVSLPLMRKNQHENQTHLMRYNSSLPALDIYTVVKSTTARLKRASLNKKPYSPKKAKCEMDEMYIRFEEIGWQNWILQPKGFNHVICQGSCSKFPRTKYLRRIGKSDRNNFKLIDHQCCGPVKFKPLKVIHLDAKEDIKLSIFEDFLVTECACLDGTD